jgi:hypothetical protein
MKRGSKAWVSIASVPPVTSVANSHEVEQREVDDLRARPPLES